MEQLNPTENLVALPGYVREMIAGGVAGGCAKTAVAPFERIKILFQTRVGSFQSMGIWRSLGYIARTQGIKGLYRGNGAGVIRIVPYAALHFMAYERYQQWLVERYPSAGPSLHLLAGSLAGGTAVLSTYPLDLARTRLALQGSRYSYKGLGHVLSTVYRESGTRGLYRGIGATLYGILPYAGLKFYVYEKLKACVPSEETSVLYKLGCGASAGLIGQTFTYPLDVVRRQMQVQELKGSTFKGLVSIVRDQGWQQMFSGLSLNYLKIVPSVAIGFVVYDGMKAWLGVSPQKQPRRDD